MFWNVIASVLEVFIDMGMMSSTLSNNKIIVDFLRVYLAESLFRCGCF